MGVILSDDKGAAAKFRLDRREAIQSQIAQFQVMRPLEITKIFEFYIAAESFCDCIDLLERFSLKGVFTLVP